MTPRKSISKRQGCWDTGFTTRTQAWSWTRKGLGSEAREPRHLEEVVERMGRTPFGVRCIVGNKEDSNMSELRSRMMVRDALVRSRCVNTIPPNTEKWLRKLYMKIMATVYSYENEVNENYSITSNTGTTRTPTSRPQSTTPMTTLPSTIAWRTCTESARIAHVFDSCDCLTLHIPWLKVLSTFISPSMTIFMVRSP